MDLDPFSDAFLSNPYPYHEELRDAGAVVFLERYRVWAMARYDEVVATLRDWKTFCSSAGVGLSNFLDEEPWRPPSLLLEADPPDHTSVRSVVYRILSSRALEALREDFEQKAETIVSRAMEKEKIDGVADLAQALPLEVFPAAVGLRNPDPDMLLPYADMAFNAFGPHNELLRKSMARAEEITTWIAAQCQREALTDDGFGAQIYAAADNGDITLEQAPLLVRSLLTAGLDTTVYGISHALNCLARNPDQWQLLRENPSLARDALDEAVRLESPVQTFFRTTSTEVDVAGTHLGKNQKVLLFLASANRDPRRWEEPDRYDILRKTRGHVGFGAGIHMCVGQMLARLEAEVLLAALANRVAIIEPLGEPVTRLNNTLRGYSSIPLSLCAA